MMPYISTTDIKVLSEDMEAAPVLSHRSAKFSQAWYRRKDWMLPHMSSTNSFI